MRAKDNSDGRSVPARIMAGLDVVVRDAGQLGFSETARRARLKKPKTHRVATEMARRSSPALWRRPPGTSLRPARPIDVPGADFWRFEAGLIVAYHLYFDQLEFLRQPGLAPSS